MSDDTHFQQHLRSERSGLFRVGLLLLLQSIVTAGLLLPLMILIDGLVIALRPEALPPTSGSLSTLLSWIGPEWTEKQLLLFAAGLLGLLTLVSAALEFAERVSVTRVAYAVVERLREDLFSRLLTRRQSYLERKRNADLVARLSTDAGALEELIGGGLATFARALPTLILVFAILFALQASLALLTLAALPVPYFLHLYFSRAARANVIRLHSETQNFESEASRLLAAGPVIKSLTLESFAVRTLHSRLEEIGASIMKLRRADGARIAVSSGANQLLRAILLALGGLSVLRGELGLGALAVFLVALGALSRSVGAIAQFISDFGRAESSLERIEALFRELEDQGERQGNQALISLPFPDATTLHFENVTFGYPGTPVLLQKFNSSFHAGELIALTGPSGSGRTTFGRLLNRLLDPLEGRILLGRTDLKRFRLDVLRTYMTVVDHKPFFVPGTVRENLLLGAESSEIREQQISESLHGANAYDFVQALPDKLDTIIGEGGHELSSSELRRLGIARALLREQSQVFVLDEPTTGLDADSVAAVVTAIHKLADRGATVFWITNRLEEIPQCDRVVLFSRVRDPIVGTHDQLLAEDATYRSYFAPLESPRSARTRPRTESPAGTARPDSH